MILRRFLVLVLAAGCATTGEPGPVPSEAPEPDPLIDPADTLTLDKVLEQSSDEDWRALEPENTLYLELPQGRVVIELAPAFAPRHVDNIRTLVRRGYFDDGGAVIRSHDNYVVQWAARGSGGEEDPPWAGVAATALPPEFEVPSTGLRFTPLPDPDTYAPEVGFTHGFPVGRDPGTGMTWIAHCYGVVGVARAVDAATGSGAQLYAVIGHSPRHLDRNLSMVGRVVQGIELLAALPRGEGPLGFYETEARRVPILAARLGSQLPPGERADLELLRTDTETFRNVIRSRRHRGEDFFVHPTDRIGLCNVPLPVREAAGSRP